MPVLLMRGQRSTVSAHGVARRLAPVLPQVRVQVQVQVQVQVPAFETLGHMGPVSYLEPVNRAVADVLLRKTI